MFSRWLKWTRARSGALARNGFSCPLAIIILAGVLCAATLSLGDKAHAAQKQKSALFQDKTEMLRRRGYVALSGEEAVDLLVGNSIVIRTTDTPTGIAADERDQRYYFSDRHTAYECVGNDCWTQPWKVDGKEICVEFIQRCDDPTNRLYVAPRLFRASHPDERTARIGVYLTYKSIAHAVVKGNATIAPLVDPGGTGKMIEASSSDFSREIEASSKFSGGDSKVPVVGPRAISFLIGNTFISGETVTDAQGGIHLCPDQGYYYSPDGRIIAFNCHHEPDWPDSWSMHVTHWKLASGRLCFEDLSGNGKFGCGDRFERVFLTPSDQPNAWHLATEDFPRKIVGYSGNVFNFK